MPRPRHLTIIMLLSLVQGFIATLVALFWFGIASIFSPESGLTSPMIVMLAQAKGGFLIVLALIYFVFVWGAWHMHYWAWWVGLLASVLSILYVVRVVLGGGSMVVGLFVLIIPLVLVWYLLCPMGRQALLGR